MSDVKRYSPQIFDDGSNRWAEMDEDKFGAWCRYSDYTALRSRLEAVEKERDEAVAQNDRLWAANHRLVSTADAGFERADEAEARAERAEAALALRNGECEAKKIIITQLEAALATARRDAANIARSFSCCHVPDEIAALIDKDATP